MRRARFGFGTAALGVAGVVGVLMLVPAQPSTEAKTAPETQTAFATSPELATFLNNAVDPARGEQTSDQVIAAVAAAPEASEVDIAAATPKAPVQGLALPETADMTVTASVVAPRETLSARTAVNMRSGPSTDYATIIVLQPDEPVAVLERNGSWTKVEKSDGAIGWVYGNYLGDGTPAVTAPSRSPEVRQALVEPRELEATPVRRSFFEPRRSRVESRRGDSELAAIRLRSAPSSRAETIVTIEAGTPLRIAEKRRGWARVVIPGGISGWVRTN